MRCNGWALAFYSFSSSFWAQKKPLFGALEFEDIRATGGLQM